MMKKMNKFFAFSMAVAMMGTLAACGSAPADDAASSGDVENAMVYAVEAGSAGEAVAKEKGFTYNSVAAQADTLMEVSAGTSDAAIIDLLMANAMIGEGTSYPNLKYTDSLTEELYGIGCRQESDLPEFINAVLAGAYADGTMSTLAETYKIAEDALVPQEAVEFDFAAYEPAEGGDVAYIKEKGKMVVGMTEFAPMDYRGEKDDWIGFDADLAKLVAEKLGVEIEFVVLDWDMKIMELNSKNVDVLWNGMTLTDEVLNSMATTNAYCKNAQVIVVPAE